MIMVEKPRVPGMNGRSLAISVTYCESCSSPSRGFLAVRLASITAMTWPASSYSEKSVKPFQRFGSYPATGTSNRT